MSTDARLAARIFNCSRRSRSKPPRSLREPGSSSAKGSSLPSSLSQLAEELSAPLESLEYHLVGLFTNAPPQDPDMVATLENAIERVGTIRRVLKDLSSSSPEESPKTSSRPR